MITVFIETRNDEVALAHALVALVPAATEGIVREVIVVDHGSEDGTLVVADAAGCTIVRARAVDGDPRRHAAERARGDWLLFLPPAARLPQGWQSEAVTFIDRALAAGRGRRAVGRLRRGRLETGWWSALAARLRRLSGKPADGVLVSREAWLATTAASPASAASFASGARRGAA